MNLFVVALLFGCAPQRPEPGPNANAVPEFANDRFITDDGVALPLDVWRPAGPSWAVALALHGMNDYRRAFAPLAGEMSERGITVYAYDQRGFGAAPGRGLWPGSEALIGDLNAALRLVRSRHPGLPVILIGESMGGAVVLADLAEAAKRPPPAGSGGWQRPDGIVLIAPAVWGGPALGAVPIGAAWLLAHTAPWFLLYANLGIEPSDNLSMLQRYARDPMVIRETRADAVLGLVELMGKAQAAAPFLKLPSLIIYGGQDQIIPKSAMCSVIEALPEDAAWRVAYYPQGHHMISRDLAGRGVADDVVAWMADAKAPLPSGTEIGHAMPGRPADPALRAPGLCSSYEARLDP